MRSLNKFMIHSLLPHSTACDNVDVIHSLLSISKSVRSKERRFVQQMSFMLKTNLMQVFFDVFLHIHFRIVETF